MNKQRLNIRLAELNMSQRELAEKTGMSQVAIHKLCRGKTKESKKNFLIAKVLDVPLAWLIGESNHRAPLDQQVLLNEISDYFDLDAPEQQVVRRLIQYLKDAQTKP